MARLIDLMGQRFGDWIVISRASNDSGGRARWNCKCVCGTEREVQGAHLRGGRSTGCGCERMKKMRATRVKNEVGNTYGKLRVVEEDNNPPRKDRYGIYWICECDCGNRVSVFGDYLRNGDTISCGCVTSKGEMEIAKLLSKNGIEFKTQQTFSDLKSEKGYLLRFDFGIYKDGVLSHLVEYDGIQHFKSATTKTSWNTDENLKKTMENDRIKNKYCEDNNIRLIRISYNQQYGLEDLI